MLAGMEPVAEPVCVPDDESTDTDELLGEAGIPPDRIAELRARQVIA